MSTPVEELRLAMEQRAKNEITEAELAAIVQRLHKAAQFLGQPENPITRVSDASPRITNKRIPKHNAGDGQEDFSN